jgi:chemotaxis protein histidine kinase CheA
VNENKNKKEPVEDAQFFPASLKLQQKVPMTNKNLNYILKDADSGIKKMSTDYITWVQNDILKLEEAFLALKRNPADKKEIDKVHWIAHDMKGQGGTFGYKLMTTVLDYLCTYLERQEVMSNDGLDVIQLHIEAAKTIINNRLTEDGGETGDQILLGLQKMINKKG